MVPVLMMAIVSHTSNVPQNHVGNCLGLDIAGMLWDVVSSLIIGGGCIGVSLQFYSRIRRKNPCPLGLR